MKIVTDKRIPGLEEGLSRMVSSSVSIVAKEGSEISTADVKDADALFVRTRTHCDNSLLADSNVRLIGTATIGTDHIDIPWCEANGIRVVSAPGCNAPAVMQYVAASLHEAGFDPAIHTLGIVGKGHIGSLVADLYRSAGTRVLVCDPPRRDAGHKDESYLSLEEVFDKSDAVTFHVPYFINPDTRNGAYPTHHLLTPSLLRRHQRPRMLVNASRGAVFDPRVFEEDRLFIIDTWPFEDEPYAWNEDERRRIIDKAFISTPHIAGYSIEGKRRATSAMLSAFAEFAGIDILLETDIPQVSPGKYRLPETIRSFDPKPLSDALKKDPSSFERQRSEHLRHEPA